ncbi:MAG: hypothetical protein AAFR28_14225, partial [Pseudomonadota bacterium]
MRVSQVTFSAGETTPELHARSDMTFSDRGLSYALNGIILKTGGFAKRWGLRYIADCADHARASRLIPYDFGIEQTYILELAHEAIRFVTMGGQLVDGGSPVEVASPYQESERFDIGYASTRDVTKLVHLNHAPRDLNRLGATNWSLTLSSFSVSQTAPGTLTLSTTTDADSDSVALPATYVVTAVNDESGEESLASAEATQAGSGTTDAVLVEWDHVAGANFYNVYKESSGVFGYVGRASGESGTVSFVDNGFDPDETQTPPTTRNPFDSASNYPEAVTFHQQRIVYGSTLNDPTLIETSRTALFSNFTRSEPSQATDAISVSVLGRRVQRVRHMISLRDLLILTTNGQWALRGTDGNVLTPSQTEIESQSERGTSAVVPIISGQAAIYVMRDGRTVRDIGYAFSDDAYIGKDLTAASEHLLDGRTIVDMAYQETRDQVVWFVLSDGTGLCLTYFPEHEVIAWTRLETNGQLESVAA